MNIALTGGTGTLGRALLPALLDAGHSVRLLIRPTTYKALPAFTPGITAVEVALEDAKAVALAMDQSDLVIHAAAPQSGSIEQQHAATVQGTRVVLEAMRLAGIKRLVGLSSLAVYQYSGLLPGSRLTEDTPLEACPSRRDAYTQCKIAQDQLFREPLKGMHSLRTVVLRPGIFYSNPTQWPIGLGKALGQRYWALMGPLNHNHRLPMVHVDDVARGVLSAVDRLSQPINANPSVDVFNLVEPDAPSATDLLAALCKLPVRPTCVRIPWSLQQRLAGALEQVERLMGKSLPIPGLLRPDWMASRFCQLEFDVHWAQTELGWQAQHRILDALASSSV